MEHTAEADMAHAGIDHLRTAGGGPVAHAIAIGAEIRAALDHFPRHSELGLPAVVAVVDGAASRITRAYEVPSGETGISEGGPSIAEHFDWHIWQPSQRMGPFTVRTVPVEHPVEAYAIRVQEDVAGGGAMVYSGDTGPSEALVRLATGVDLLLVESAFLDDPDNPDGMHLSGRQAAAIGQAAGVAAIVITHIPPWYDPDRVLAEATPHFDGPVSLAKPGAVWDIGGV